MNHLPHILEILSFLILYFFFNLHLSSHDQQQDQITVSVRLNILGKCLQLPTVWLKISPDSYSL